MASFICAPAAFCLEEYGFSLVRCGAREPQVHEEFDDLHLLALRRGPTTRCEQPSLCLFSETMADGGSSSSSGSGSGSGAAELKAGPVELRHQFNPDMHKNECMADAAISFDGNKYFLGGTLTGIVGMALIPRSQILYLRAAPFLVGGLAGIVADWWDNSSRCTEETRARLQAFLASQQSAAQKK